MTTVRMALSKPMVLARAADAKGVTRRMVTRANSLVDGSPCPADVWACLDWSKAWVDRGPSPAGNEGPYYKVPKPFDQDGAPIDTVHRVYPRLAPGDIILWGESVERDDDGWAVYTADREPVVGHPSWLKEDGSPYAVSRLSATYCPVAWVRYKDVVRSVGPSTPADVNTPEEARAEGLIEINGAYLTLGADLSPRDASGWSWARHDRAYSTPAEAYSALLADLHGSPVDPATPMWRVQFSPAEVAP